MDFLLAKDGGIRPIATPGNIYFAKYQSKVTAFDNVGKPLLDLLTYLIKSYSYGYLLKDRLMMGQIHCLDYHILPVLDMRTVGGSTDVLPSLAFTTTGLVVYSTHYGLDGMYLIKQIPGEDDTIFGWDSFHVTQAMPRHSKYGQGFYYLVYRIAILLMTKALRTSRITASDTNSWIVENHTEAIIEKLATHKGLDKYDMAKVFSDIWKERFPDLNSFNNPFPAHLEKAYMWSIALEHVNQASKTPQIDPHVNYNCNLAICTTAQRSSLFRNYKSMVDSLEGFVTYYPTVVGPAGDPPAERDLRKRAHYYTAVAGRMDAFELKMIPVQTDGYHTFNPFLN